MSHDSTITIAGLGAGAPGDITLAAWEALKSSSRIWLRTEKHPVVEWLRSEGISFSTFDNFYEEGKNFQEVYARIARAVLREAGQGPVLYAVPGHPLVAEESVRLVISQAEREGLQVRILPAVSFLDAVFSALRLDPGEGLQVVDGLRLDEAMPVSTRATVVTQMYSRLVASEIKLALLEIYPPEHPVTVVRGAGIPGEEIIKAIPLYELDRLPWVDHLTSVYIPQISRRTSDVGRRENEKTVISEANTGEAAEVIQLYEDDGASPTGSFEEKETNSPGDRPCRFPLDSLMEIMARLRGEDGCPWDREQDHRTLKPYLIEEAYEVLEAIDEENTHKICEELGDLLLQIVFHAQIASETQQFDVNDVVAGIVDKMIRRHPHVFGTVTVRDSSEVLLNWAKIKEKEKNHTPKCLLAGVPANLPSLMRAARLQEKASGAGFDWPDYQGALDKVREELGELEAVITGGDRVQVEREMGDVFFSAVNLARLLGLDSEIALAQTSAKFVRRFGHVEKRARLSGKDVSQCALSELDMWWEEAKKQEKIKETFS